MICFPCPNCAKELKIENESWLGRQTQCPHCNQSFEVSRPSGTLQREQTLQTAAAAVGSAAESPVSLPDYQVPSQRTAPPSMPPEQLIVASSPDALLATHIEVSAESRSPKSPSTWTLLLFLLCIGMGALLLVSINSNNELKRRLEQMENNQMNLLPMPASPPAEKQEELPPPTDPEPPKPQPEKEEQPARGVEESRSGPLADIDWNKQLKGALREMEEKHPRPKSSAPPKPAGTPESKRVIDEPFAPGKQKLGALDGKRQDRQKRWTMIFNIRDPEDYARQLQALGAVLAVAGRDESEHLVIENLSKRPVVAKPKNVSEINRMFWIDDRPDSVGPLFRVLGYEPIPSYFVAFFPQKLERELLKKELAYNNLPEEKIEETRFQIKRTASGYEPAVIRQETKP